MKTTAIFGALLLMSSAACGGISDNNGNDGGGNDAPSPVCPSSPPSASIPSSCSDPGVTCEYGSDPNPYCNTVATCTSGTWSVQEPSPSGCPTPPNPTSCPATFASVPVGTHCGALVGTTCEYPQGNCGCAVQSGGPYPEDASAVALWFCDDPGPGCPMPRPRFGAACSQPGLDCDYSSCTLQTGVNVVCKDGAWENQPIGCAL